MTTQSFLQTFAVPAAAVEAIDRFVRPAEIALVEHFGEVCFSAAETVPVLAAKTGESWTVERAEDLLDVAYRRGVLRMVDESSGRFQAATFAERLELMVVGHPEEYETLDADLRGRLDEWCFGAYLRSLGTDGRPTSDRVVTLGETLATIDAEDREIWLNTCDCAVLAGKCDRPRETCITFRSGINTTSHRGLSRRPTKAEAKAIISSANASGLMQTVNDNGVCNCCADCCYLFRAQEARASAKEWPASVSIASIDTSICIECGACVERCPFGVYALGDDGLTAALEHCRGCGLCAGTCPTEAIVMRPRGEHQ